LRPRWGDAGHGHDLTDLENVDAKKLGFAQCAVGAQAKKQQLELVGACEVGALFNISLHVFHGNVLCVDTRFYKF
jgi:hypothetical protein